MHRSDNTAQAGEKEEIFQLERIFFTVFVVKNLTEGTLSKSMRFPPDAALLKILGRYAKYYPGFLGQSSQSI